MKCNSIVNVLNAKMEEMNLTRWNLMGMRNPLLSSIKKSQG